MRTVLQLLGGGVIGLVVGAILGGAPFGAIGAIIGGFIGGGVATAFMVLVILSRDKKVE
jgi:uncharacterized membrane protein